MRGLELENDIINHRLKTRELHWNIRIFRHGKRQPFKVQAAMQATEKPFSGRFFDAGRQL